MPHQPHEKPLELRTLRINDIKLPLDHGPQALAQAIVGILGIAPAELLDVALFKRS